MRPLNPPEIICIYIKHNSFLQVICSQPLRRPYKNLLQHNTDCIGLSAIQLGLPFQFFAVNIESESRSRAVLMVNPALTRVLGTARNIGLEGCLSLPGCVNIEINMRVY